jgi:hypothetical protein
MAALRHDLIHANPCWSFIQSASAMSQYSTEWHLDEAALVWLDALLDQEYKRGITAHDLSAHTRARELVALMRAQIGSRA